METGADEEKMHVNTFLDENKDKNRVITASGQRQF